MSQPPAVGIELRRPFTMADAKRAGLSRMHVRGLLSKGWVRPILYGVMVDAGTEDTIELRSAALARVCPPGSIICDRTAAWLHGVDIQIERDPLWLPPLEVFRSGGDGLRRAETVRGKRTLDLDRDVVEVGEVQVTSLLRTGCDLGRLLRRHNAFAAMNALAAAGRLTTSMFELELPRFGGMRGVVQFRDLAVKLEPTVESPAESVVLLQIIDAGLPTPQAQHIVRDRFGNIVARLDFAYPELLLAVEYDGEIGHSTPEQQERDLRRRSRLAAMGWTSLVLTSADVFVPDPRTARLVRAAMEAAVARSV
jgi:hypothetical protein